MTAPRFYRADGRLSAYGLACGYVANAKIGSVDVELYREHGVYHVRRIDRSGTSGPIESWRTWDSFHTVNEAWARWNRHVSALYCGKDGARCHLCNAPVYYQDSRPEPSCECYSAQDGAHRAQRGAE